MTQVGGRAGAPEGVDHGVERVVSKGELCGILLRSSVGRGERAMNTSPWDWGAKGVKSHLDSNKASNMMSGRAGGQKIAYSHRFIASAPKCDKGVSLVLV